VGGEFLLGSLENAQPHALGVALPFQCSLSLGQIVSLDDSRMADVYTAFAVCEIHAPRGIIPPRRQLRPG
jgi:hypothetical protein